MRAKRIVLMIVIIVLLLFVGIIMNFYHQTSGIELLEYIQAESFASVTVEKTLEDSEGVQSLAHLTLTADEITQLYDCLANAEVRNIRKSFFWIESEIRYYILFINTEGNEVCRIKFYDDDILIFDYTPGTTPAVHKRCKIQWSTFDQYFNEIFT